MKDALPTRLRLRVFLSSTYFDLRECREYLRLSLDRLHWLDVKRMESECSRPTGVLSGSLEMIEDCHIYVALIGKRYGTAIEDDRGCISMTEREFDYATELKLYRTVFIAQERRNEQQDSEPLRAFQKKASAAIWPDFFKNKYHLADIVKDALWHVWIRHSGRMLITTAQPWEDFARSVKPYVELRTRIAE
ncbi:MAG: DUF4062 domain-containing protein, partial [candidate division WOR-3 bacterium]